MNSATWRTIVSITALAAVSGCMDNHYYVRTGGSTDLIAGVAELRASPTKPTPLDLGVTFRSAGKVLVQASEDSFESVRDHLGTKGLWTVRRVGRAGDDFAPAIAAVHPVVLDTKPGVRARPTMTPRLLVLIDDRPDLSSSTRNSYFLSGMSYGTYPVHQATDRYDVTIDYRDAYGIERIYRGHQDIIFATGSKLFGGDDAQLAGFKRYDSALAAFEVVVDNSVNGTRRGKATVGNVVAVQSSATTPPITQLGR